MSNAILRQWLVRGLLVSGLFAQGLVLGAITFGWSDSTPEDASKPAEHSDPTAATLKPDSVSPNLLSQVALGQKRDLGERLLISGQKNEWQLNQRVFVQ